MARTARDEYVWVLRNARLSGSDPELTTAAAFARALGVHPAQVTRWERGEVQQREPVLRRYEQALGLCEQQLSLVLAFLARTRSRLAPPHRAVELDEPRRREVSSLLESAVGWQPLTGPQWLMLTAVLADRRTVILRDRDWSELLLRLTRELAVTCGLDYAARWESAARLVGNIGSARSVLAVAESVLSEAEPMPFSEYAALLQYSPDPAALALLVDEAIRARSQDTRWASLFAIGTWARDPQVAARVAPQVLPVVHETLNDRRACHALTLSAAWLARVLDPAGAPQLARALAASGGSEAARTVLLEGNALPARLRQARVRQTLSAIADAGLPAGDPVLDGIVEEALTSAEQEVRGNALGALMLIPQGVPIAGIAARRLDQALAGGGPDGLRTANDVLTTLSWLARPDQLAWLVDRLVATDTDPALHWPLARAAGNCPAPGGETLAACDERVVAWATGRLGAGAEADRAITAAACYVVGMHGRTDLLRQLSEHTAGHGRWAGSPLWWLRLPAAIRPRPR